VVTQWFGVGVRTLFRINLFGSPEKKFETVYVQIDQRSGTVRVRYIIVGSRQQCNVIKNESEPIFYFFLSIQ